MPQTPRNIYWLKTDRDNERKINEIIKAVNENNVKMNSVFQIRTEPEFITAKKLLMKVFGDVILLMPI